MRVSDGPTDHYSKTVSSVMVGGTSEYRGDVKDMRALFYVLCFFLFPFLDWGNTPKNRKLHENSWELTMETR
jgi:hypothetical protein